LLSCFPAWAHRVEERGNGNCLQDSDARDPWLAPADGWETLHENKHPVFLSALLAGTARTGSWFDPSVLPSWMPGESLGGGGKRCFACTRTGRKILGVWSPCYHHFIPQPYQSTYVSGQMHPLHKDVIGLPPAP